MRALAACIVIMAVLSSAGVAHAEPNPAPPAIPSIIDLITMTPAITVDSQDDRDLSEDWGGVGMFCQNHWVRCR